MLDISKYLEVTDIFLSSTITEYDEFTQIKDGVAYFQPKLRHDWIVEVQYKKFKIEKLELDCRFSIEQIPLSKKNWNKISNDAFNYDTYPDMEAVFTYYEHETVDNVNCEISHYKDDLFKVKADFEITINHFIDQPIYGKNAIDSLVRYKALEVQTFKIQPKPMTGDIVKRYLKDTVDLTYYHEPVIENEYKCILKPKVFKILGFMR